MSALHAIWVGLLKELAVRFQFLGHVMAVASPWNWLALFLAGSLLMVWRLGALERKGLEGTVLGTLVMPYASGFANLMFAYVMGKTGGSGRLVLENCLVNNVTNMTLLLGTPAIFWSLAVVPAKSAGGRRRGSRKAHRLNYLSLLLTLLAALFFAGALWALARDGVLDFGDGLVLVGIFLFWQLFHIFDVLKHNVRHGRKLHWSTAIDAAFVIAGGYVVFLSIERIVAWMPRTGTGWFVFANLGWLSGLLMVLPNALLALYYAFARRADIVYSSQVGDGHICIPMCVGLFALFTTVSVPAYLNLGIAILAGATLLHFLFIAFWGRLPRFMGWVYAGAYFVFLYKGILTAPSP